MTFEERSMSFKNTQKIIKNIQKLSKIMNNTERKRKTTSHREEHSKTHQNLSNIIKNTQQITEIPQKLSKHLQQFSKLIKNHQKIIKNPHKITKYPKTISKTIKKTSKAFKSHQKAIKKHENQLKTTSDREKQHQNTSNIIKQWFLIDVFCFWWFSMFFDEFWIILDGFSIYHFIQWEDWYLMNFDGFSMDFDEFSMTFDERSMSFKNTQKIIKNTHKHSKKHPNPSKILRKHQKRSKALKKSSKNSQKPSTNPQKQKHQKAPKNFQKSSKPLKKSSKPLRKSRKTIKKTSTTLNKSSTTLNKSSKPLNNSQSSSKTIKNISKTLKKEKPSKIIKNSQRWVRCTQKISEWVVRKVVWVFVCLFVLSASEVFVFNFDCFIVQKIVGWEGSFRFIDWFVRLIDGVLEGSWGGHIYSWGGKIRMSMHWFGWGFLMGSYIDRRQPCYCYKSQATMMSHKESRLLIIADIEKFDSQFVSSCSGPAAARRQNQSRTAHRLPLIERWLNIFNVYVASEKIISNYSSTSHHCLGSFSIFSSFVFRFFCFFNKAVLFLHEILPSSILNRQLKKENKLVYNQEFSTIILTIVQQELKADYLQKPQNRFFQLSHIHTHTITTQPAHIH